MNILSQDWKAKAKLILTWRVRRWTALLTCYEHLESDVFLSVMENTAAFLKENHKDSYIEFIENVDFAYEFYLKQISKDEARTAPGDPAALIPFPIKTKRKSSF